MIALQEQLIKWADGIAFEANFWRDWFAQKGGRWPGEYADRMNPQALINPQVEQLLGAIEGRKARILDVGAGPITVIGYIRREGEAEIVPVDPLAPLYERFYEEFGVAPPVPTRFAVAEDLSSAFPGEFFDLVHCRNALDHSFDPIRGLEEMLRVTKVGGHVLLLHHQNEAEHGNYDGFHQFNFTVESGSFVVWNKAERFVPHEIFGSFARFSSKLEANYVTVVIEKVAEIPDAASAERIARRLGAVWEASIRALTSRALAP